MVHLRYSKQLGPKPRIELHFQSCLIKVEDVQSLQSQMQIVLQEVRILLRCYLRNCMRATKANTIYCIVVNMSSGAIQHQLRAQRDGHHVRSDLHKYFVTICDDTQYFIFEQRQIHVKSLEIPVLIDTLLNYSSFSCINAKSKIICYDSHWSKT